MRLRILASHIPILIRAAASVRFPFCRKNGLFAVLTICLGLFMGAHPAQAQCTPVEIASTAMASGSLSVGDCTIAQLGIDPQDLSFVDVYSVTLVEDGFLTVTLDSAQFDAFLGIFDSTLTQLVAGDDDGGGDSNSRVWAVPIPAGTYLILANSFLDGQTGGYTLNTLFELSGNPECAIQVALPSTAIADDSLSTTDCTIAQLGIDGGDGSSVDQYRVELPTGGPLTILLESVAFDAFLWLFDETLTNVLAVDDDGAGGTDSTLQDIQLDPGTYIILANSCCSGHTGPYTLTLIPEPSILLLRLAAVGTLIALARSRKRRR